MKYNITRPDPVICAVSPLQREELSVSLTGGAMLELTDGKVSFPIAGAEVYGNYTFSYEISAVTCSAGGCSWGGGASFSPVGGAIGVRACMLGWCAGGQFNI